MSETIVFEPGLEITRDEHGVPRVAAADDLRMYRGLGYCHAHDRGLQILLMRILGEGRLSEQLDSSDEALKIDLFFRRMNWSGPAPEASTEDPRTRALIEAYCAGVNARFDRGLPWELRLAGYRHEGWRPEHTVLLTRMAGYLTLAQSQGEVERLIVEMVQAGVTRERLEELFPGELERLDEDLVRSIRLGERLVPADLRWAGGVRLMASNNWVVSGARTASGKPMLCNDPHLEANRLPAVWYEISLRSGDRWGLGATMPGLPALLLGRTQDLAWGATYTFADAQDSWVEECRDGLYLRAGAWLPFRRREETILRRGKAAARATFFENDHGVLEGDPHEPGRYLATRWSGAEAGLRSLSAAAAVFEASTVAEGMTCLGTLEVSFNWVLADSGGSIGYQMSGLVPRRRSGASGLVPLAGWDPENDWAGFRDAEELPRQLNPESGIIVTANNDLNPLGRARAISVSMGSYRADRIAQRLGEAERLSASDMGAIQQDTFSLQAERFMRILRPLLPDTPAGQVLRQWDHRYDPDAVAPTLFEAVYRNLRRAVFGPDVVDHLLDRTGLFADFFAAFDRVLLADGSAWFDGARDEIYRRVLADTLAQTEARPWGAGQRIMLRHILFGGKLPSFLGFDRGPVTLPGGRATPQQGQIYRSGGRVTSFVPSYRLIADLGEPCVHTAHLGGPSDRRWSRWYASEVARWVKGQYKTLRAAPALLLLLILPTGLFSGCGATEADCRADSGCPVGQVCATGRCETLACTLEYAPVCGIDGRTYGNACAARGAHVTVRSQGECPKTTAP